MQVFSEPEISRIDSNNMVVSSSRTIPFEMQMMLIVIFPLSLTFPVTYRCR